MKGAWKKVSGSATATDSSKGDRRGSASKDFPPLSSAGIGGDSAGVSDANSNSNALFSKLRQTVATAQLAAHNLHLAAVSPSAAFEKRKVTIWPEWNDNEVNVEKWDASCAPKGKDDKKGKSPTASAYFEDPDGKLDLPASLRVDHWKRPHDFMDDDRCGDVAMGDVVMWQCGDVAMGDVVMWQCGDVAMGDVVMWQCGDVAMGDIVMWQWDDVVVW
ncbi:hypothetical protein ACOMHN_065907 [Nucella lapillus]